MRPDILLFMTDQHAGRYMGCDGGMVDTPNLDALVADGTRFANCYTACPLCVPARMSMLAGRLPTRIGATANNQTLAETTPTFLFPLVEAGYETVLIGRMHFIGKDLRHGFLKRIGGDMTPTSWVPPRQQVMEERGKLAATFSSGGCLDVVGGGASPVRYYNDDIVEEALAYLAQPHEKPQFIIVGTFGPHFPYVADPALYRKYLARGWLPENWNKTPDFIEDNPWLAAHQKPADERTARRAAAAYCALVEETDRQVGRVREAFENWAARNGRKAVFGYLSDHGDTVGAFNIYGKQTFFEDSARVPLLLCGQGIPRGRVVQQNVSLMDLGPTVCAAAGTRYSGRFVDGEDLTPFFAEELPVGDDRIVMSQYIESRGGTNPWVASGAAAAPEEFAYAAMARSGRWKYVFYHGQEKQAMLFDLEADPYERENLLHACPQVTARLRSALLEAADPETAEQDHADRNRMNRWLRCVERQTGPAADERWKANRPDARGQLAVE